MSQISLKSISGITSITTPTGADNQFTLHTNNTNEALKLDGAGNLHFHNHLNITGISTASNFKTGTSNLHNTGLNVQDLDVDGHTNLDNVSIVGIVTISAGVNNEGLRITGQNNNAVIFTSPSINSSAGYRLNHHPSTNVLRVDTTDQNGTFSGIVASFSSAGLDMADNIKLRLGTSQDLTLYHYGNDAYIDNATGSILFRQGGSEKLRIDTSGRVLIGTTTEGAANADELTISYNNTGVGGGDQGRCGITIRSGDNTSGVTQNGYIYFSDGTSGDNEYRGVVAYSHSDDSMYFSTAAAERLRIASNGAIGLGGANYGSSGQVLTSGGSGSTVSWTTVSGTTINNNADNRVITGSGTANTLEGEAGLTYNGQALNVNTVTSENNAIRVYNTSTSATTFQINGEGNSFIGHTYPRSDANLDLGFHSGYRWRDVVLSGGIRFGSSSADDYLDDYEEGTFTPTINVGSFTTFLTNRYIKIGRLVHLHGGLIFNNNSSGTRVEISNIPFAQQSGGQYVGNVWLRRTSTGERNWNMILGEAGTNVLGIFRDSNGGHSDMGGHLSYSDFGSSATYFNYSITYISAS